MKILLTALGIMLCSSAMAEECLTFTEADGPGRTIHFSLEGPATISQPGKPDLQYNTAGAGTGIEGRALLPINGPASGELLYVEKDNEIVIEGEVFEPNCAEVKP